MIETNGKSRFCFKIEITLVKKVFHAVPHAAAMRNHMLIINVRAAN